MQELKYIPSFLYFALRIEDVGLRSRSGQIGPSGQPFTIPVKLSDTKKHEGNGKGPASSANLAALIARPISEVGSVPIPTTYQLTNNLARSKKVKTNHIEGEKSVQTVQQVLMDPPRA